MFNLIRRISYGVIPRADRPWEDDPTSNAPQRRKKRRLSSTERTPEDEEEQSRQKKARGDSQTPSVVDADGSMLPPPPPIDTQGVKDVTKGVDKVDLDGTHDDLSPEIPPESVPLPDECTGELDEPVEETKAPALPTDEIVPSDEASSASDASEESVPLLADESSTSNKEANLDEEEDDLDASTESTVVEPSLDLSVPGASAIKQ